MPPGRTALGPANPQAQASGTCRCRRVVLVLADADGEGLGRQHRHRCYPRRGEGEHDRAALEDSVSSARLAAPPAPQRTPPRSSGCGRCRSAYHEDLVACSARAPPGSGARRDLAVGELVRGGSARGRIGLVEGCSARLGGRPDRPTRHAPTGDGVVAGQPSPQRHARGESPASRRSIRRGRARTRDLGRATSRGRGCREQHCLAHRVAQGWHPMSCSSSVSGSGRSLRPDPALDRSRAHPELGGDGSRTA